MGYQLLLESPNLLLVLPGALQQALFGLEHLQKPVQLAVFNELAFLRTHLTDLFIQVELVRISLGERRDLLADFPHLTWDTTCSQVSLSSTRKRMASSTISGSFLMLASTKRS